MLTREELEDIMNNKPFGYGKVFKNKEVKKTTFVAVPYKRQHLEPITITVFGKAKDAYQDAQREFYSTYGKNLEYDGVEWSRQV
jgi:hypothetical protein